MSFAEEYLQVAPSCLQPKSAATKSPPLKPPVIKLAATKHPLEPAVIKFTATMDNL